MMSNRIELLEDLAYKRLPCPEDVSGSELLLYLSFSALYAYAQHGELSREQGSEFKRHIVERYLDMRNREQQYDRAQLACHGIDVLIRELRQIPDLEQRPVLVAFIQTMTGGDSDGEKE